MAQALSDSGYQDPYSVVTMLDMDIEQLAYIDTDGSLVPLTRFHHGLLKTFRDWVKHLDSIGKPINDKWDGLNVVDYNKYRSSSFYPFCPTNPIQKSKISGNNKEANTLQNFKKGIKRDASLYPVLKHMRTWDSWKRGTTATARAQDVAEILDSKYVPPKIKEMEALFDKKQKFIYAVFEQTL